MAAQQIQLHRYLVVRYSDGTAAHGGALCWYGSPELPVPPPMGSAKGSPDDFYIVGMDDAIDHWLRFLAEDFYEAHLDPTLRSHGRTDGLRHSGGVPHPDHAHLYLGGTFSWDHAPHPLVQQTHAHLAALDPLVLIQHFHGPLQGAFVA